MIEALQGNPLIVAIGQSLIAFLWQGTVVALLAALLFRALKGWDPRWRYAMACVALVVMTGLPIRTTLTSYARMSPTIGSSPTAAAALPATAEPSGIPEAMSPVAERADSGRIETLSRDSWLQAIVVVWLLGVAVLSLRLAGGWVLVRRMAARGTVVDAALSARVRSIAARLRLRQRIVARRSAMVGVPTVVGWLKPTILLPASAMTGLAPEQLEAVLAHELAHIRRHDYGINVLQRLAETLLFYHPAVWWLSNRIRAEREMCADDLAVSVCGDPTLYAGALRDLEAVRTRNALAMAATGGSLPARIGRLLGQPPVRDRWSPVWTFVIFASILLVVGTGAPDSTTMAAPEGPVAAQDELIRAETPIGVTVQESVSEEETLPTEPQDTVAEGPVEPIEAEVGPQPRVEVIRAMQNDDRRGFTVALSEQVVANRGRGGVNVTVSLPASQLGLRIADGETEGALVQSVDAKSAAAEAGIQTGDLITEFAGSKVLGVRQLTRMLEETPDGRTVPVTLLRDGGTQIVELTLERLVQVLGDVLTAYREVATPLVVDALRVRPAGTIRLGFRVEDMTPELREFFGARNDQGVLVSSVFAESAAAQAGVLVGDVIVSVDGNTVSSPADLTWSAELDDPTVVLEVIRERRSQEVRVTLDLPARPLRITP